MSPPFRTLNHNDVAISQLVGLETYKALYSLWPDIYSYISDPLVPTNYYVSLVSGVVADSGLSYSDAGKIINETLINIVNNLPNSERNTVLVAPLINSSYPIKNLNYTFWENVIWISVVVVLGFWIVWYLYAVGFWNYIFNKINGVACYDCRSMFDYINF